MSKSKTTKSQKDEAHPVVAKIAVAGVALAEAAKIAKEQNCSDKIVARLQNLAATNIRTMESVEKQIATAAKKAEKAKQLEATKEERKQKILDKIAGLQAKVDAMS